MNLTPDESASPGPRYQAATAWDPQLGGLLLFGGSTNAGFSNETWLLHNGSWTELHPTHIPPAVAGAQMAFDPAQQAVVLVGGVRASSPQLPNETWVFGPNGDWAELAPPNGPGERAYGAMAYDEADGALILFGGDAGGCPLPGTWSFSGGSWTELNVTGPTPRLLEGMAEDSGDGGVLLFGGSGNGCAGDGNLQNDTWLFSGGNWARLSSTLSPSARFGAQMTADPTDAGVLLYGGAYSSTGFANDTWSFESGRWVNLTSILGASPPTTMEGVLGADPTTGATVLYGGGFSSQAGSPGLPYLGGLTWALRIPISVAVRALPPSGSVDVGARSEFFGSASGGLGGYRWNWTGLPELCNGNRSATILCQDELNRTYRLQATAADLYFQTTSPVFLYTVSAWPQPGAPALETGSYLAGFADVGMTATLTETLVQPGSGGPYEYTWVDLPSDCLSPDSPTVHCPLTMPGVSAVTVRVSDSSGLEMTSPSVTLVTNPAPQVDVATPPVDPVVGNPTALYAEIWGGTPDYSVTWSFGDGTSAFGSSATHFFRSTGNREVDVTVVDAVGVVATAKLTVNVVAAPSSAAPSEDVGLIVGAGIGATVATAILATTLGGLLLHGRRAGAGRSKDAPRKEGPPPPSRAGNPPRGPA